MQKPCVTIDIPGFGKLRINAYRRFHTVSGHFSEGCKEASQVLRLGINPVRTQRSYGVYANLTLPLDTIRVYLGWFCCFIDISQERSRI